MSDEIRRQLNANFDEYERNTVLNKLTPTKATKTPDRSKLEPPRSKGTRSRSHGSSRRATPGKTTSTGARHTDSMIVTSPVKARRYASSEDDEFDTSKNNTTVNVPLRDSPKERMRQGTPKLLSAKNSQHSKSYREPTATVLKQKSFTLRETRDLLADAEFGDDEDEAVVNDTILSDIPSDLLSPEKHIYPVDNLPKPDSSLRATKSPEGSTASQLSKKSIYPTLSPPSAASKSTQTIPSHNPLFPSESPIGPSPVPESPKKDTAPISQSTVTKPFTLFSPTRKSSTPITIHEDQVKDVRSPPRRADPRPLYPSFFESSDEEPVPELTVVLPPLEPESKKRKAGDDRPPMEKADPHQSPAKKSKPSIYPTLEVVKLVHESSPRKAQELKPAAEIKTPPQQPISTPESKDLSQKPITDATARTPLYPSIPEPVVSQPVAVRNPLVESPMQVRPETPVEVVPQVKEVTPPPAERLRGPDNWIKPQWLKFIGLYKEFEALDNDFSVFTPETLEYLRCDEDELLLKISFYKEYKTTIKLGNV